MSTELDKKLDEILEVLLTYFGYEKNVRRDDEELAKQEANQVLTKIIEDREQKAHSKGMQFALACTDPWAGVEYPTQFTPIKSTAEKWLKDLEDAELKGERDV